MKKIIIYVRPLLRWCIILYMRVCCNCAFFETGENETEMKLKLGMGGHYGSTKMLYLHHLSQLHLASGFAERML